ncbi:MAG: hypothetical protein ACREH9_03170, partial [Pseudomonadota bacterium]
ARGRSAMKADAKQQAKKSVGRRAVLRALGVGAGAVVAASAPLLESAAAQGESDQEKRKARYQANSPDVQNYYRVNRYPK